MKVIKALVAVFILLAGIRLSGQTSSVVSLAYPVYSQYLQNGLLINPAYAGSREALSLSLAQKFQWAGVEGAPVSTSLSLHSLLKNDKVGLGFTGQRYSYGNGTSQLYSLYTDYAYHLRLAKGKLAMGLTAGLDMATEKYSEAFLHSLNSWVTSGSNDPVFVNGNKPLLLPNVGAGVYFYNNKFFLGAAIPRIISWETNGVSQSINSITDFDIYVSGGALITFTPSFKFKPSVFVDYSLQDTKEMRIDINCNFIIKDFLWIGGSWRTSEQVAVGIVQLQVNPQIMFGYSLDYPLGDMNTYSKGSHEIFFRYEFSYKVSATNPRYF
jgi:type IX secretion system PorP/SprF family membrane protein